MPPHHHIVMEIKQEQKERIQGHINDVVKRLGANKSVHIFCSHCGIEILSCVQMSGAVIREIEKFYDENHRRCSKCEHYYNKNKDRLFCSRCGNTVYAQTKDLKNQFLERGARCQKCGEYDQQKKQ